MFDTFLVLFTICLCASPLSGLSSIMVSPALHRTLGETTADVLQRAWNVHYLALINRDLPLLINGYSNDTIFEVYQSNRGVFLQGGKNDAQQIYTGLFTQMVNTNDFQPILIELDFGPGLEEAMPGGLVHFIWRSMGSGIDSVVEVLAFNSEGEIFRHSLVVVYHDASCITCSKELLSTQFPNPLPPMSQSVSQADLNHGMAFSTRNTKAIAADYCEDSVFRLYDLGPEALHVFTGPTEVSAGFSEFFGALPLNGPSVPAQAGVVDSNGNYMKFLVWHDEQDGFDFGTDMFFFNSKGTILRQNIVAHNLNGAWFQNASGN